MPSDPVKWLEGLSEHDRLILDIKAAIALNQIVRAADLYRELIDRFGRPAR